MISGTTAPPRAGPVTEVLTVHAALREHFARAHVGFVDDSTGQDRWVEYPNGMVTVIVNVGAAFGGHPSAFVAGMTETRDVIERDGPIECLDLKLTPPGARRLLGVPLEELTGSVVPLRDVLGPSADELAERIPTHSTWTARARILEAVLLRRGDDVPGVDRRIEWAWRRIVTRHETVSIQELVHENSSANSAAPAWAAWGAWATSWGSRPPRWPGGGPPSAQWLPRGRLLPKVVPPPRSRCR